MSTKSPVWGKMNEFTIRSWVGRMGRPGPFTPGFKPNGEGLQIVEHELWLDGACIAKWSGYQHQYLHVTLDGITNKRAIKFLNFIPSINVEEKDGSYRLNGKPWTGAWAYLHSTSLSNWRYVK
jgi:hypothetical protein